jgi:hypothetical protein
MAVTASARRAHTTAACAGPALGWGACSAGSVTSVAHRACRHEIRGNGNVTLLVRPGQRGTPRGSGSVWIASSLEKKRGHLPLPPSRGHPEGRRTVLVIDGVDVGASFRASSGRSIVVHWISLRIASASSVVFALPPRSGVRLLPLATTRSMAPTMRSCRSLWPR